jgi:hypothetical protein
MLVSSVDMNMPTTTTASGKPQCATCVAGAGDDPPGRGLGGGGRRTGGSGVACPHEPGGSNSVTDRGGNPDPAVVPRSVLVPDLVTTRGPEPL